MRLRGLIFDWDGVVVDSSDHIHAAYNHLYVCGLSRRHFPSKEMFLDFFDTDYMKNATSLGWDTQEKIQAALTEYQSFMQKQGNAETVQDGISQLLCGSLKYETRGIATNMDNTGYVIEDIMHRQGLDLYFNAVVGREKVYHLRKPHPAVVQKCLYELKLNAKEAAFLGDSPNDIIAGKRAGVLTLAAGWGLSSKDKLLAEKPDFYCAHPNEVLEVLKHV